MLKFFIKSITIIFLLTHISSAYAGDAEKGKKVFNKCKACHGIDEGGKNKLGPNLWNMVGAPIAAVDGYKYSKALIESDIIWNEESINRLFDEGPDKVTPGTKMPIQRMKKIQDRQDLVMFLKKATN